MRCFVLSLNPVIHPIFQWITWAKSMISGDHNLHNLSLFRDTWHREVNAEKLHIGLMGH